MKEKKFWKNGFYYCKYTKRTLELVGYWRISQRGILLKDAEGRVIKTYECEKPWLEYWGESK